MRLASATMPANTSNAMPIDTTGVTATATNDSKTALGSIMHLTFA